MYEKGYHVLDKMRQAREACLACLADLKELQLCGVTVPCCPAMLSGDVMLTSVSLSL